MIYINNKEYVYKMTKADELKLKIQSNEISAMYEIVINILMKYTDKLYEAENFEKLFIPYILCRYISMKESLVPIAEYLSSINSTAKLSKIQFYKLAYSLIPKQKNGFIKYILKKEKNKKEINNNNENNIIENSLFNL